MGLTKQQLTTMTDYRIELQAFVDAAASFTEPALGHHKAWAEAVARARVALSAPESSTNSACPITPPPELVEQWHSKSPLDRSLTVATQAARWGANIELEACVEWLGDAPVVYNDNGDLHPGSYLRDARRPKPPTLKEQALTKLAAMERLWEASGNEPSDLVRRALEQLDD